MCSDVLSIVSLIITVILGGGAMYQSWKYNKDTEKIAEDTERDNYMTAEEAKAYGLIDEIVESRNAAKEKE